MKNELDLDYLYLVATMTDPARVDWKEAFAQCHRTLEHEAADARKRIAALESRVAELEGGAEAQAVAVAERLRDLDGDSVAVECKTWARQHGGVDVDWVCYSAKRRHHFSARTLAEAEAAFMADLAPVEPPAAEPEVLPVPKPAMPF